MSVKNLTRVYGYCDCFFSRNIFLQKYRLHINYHSKEQFHEQYDEVLKSRGCSTPEDFEDVLQDIVKEIDRRRSYDKRSLERSKVIQQSYVPKHPNLYELKEEFLDEGFLELVRSNESLNVKSSSFLESLPGLDGVYRLRVFTPTFCRLLIEELDHFTASGMPCERPNTMNHSGVLLGELGFDRGLLTPLREQYLRPLCAALYPDWGGDCLDSHRAFTVNYTERGDGGDFDLATHYDNAEVTLNVCLSDGFEGGELNFGRMRHEPAGPMRPVEHRSFGALLHRAQHLHGALPVESGRRVNLIVWMRSSRVREERGCPRCSRPRHECQIEAAGGFGDGFLVGAEDVCPLS